MIVFRCNAGPEIGIGHLTRCRTLAADLRRRGHASVMFGPGQDWRVPGDERLFDAWIPRTWEGSGADAQALTDVCRSFGAGVVVVDDYRVDEEYQLALRNSGLRWMQQFNASAPPPFWGDWVVNAGPRETAERYRAQVRSPQTTFLLGPEYAVLRPQFRDLPERAASGPIRQVLISFGGGDDRGLVIRMLAALLQGGPGDVRYRVMSGRKNPGNDTLSRWIGEHAAGRAALSVDPRDVSAEYLACDLALIGGGTSTFEAAATGKPMIIVAMADNQINQALGWEDRGAAVYAGKLGSLELEEVVARVAALCADPASVAAMSMAGRLSVDARGSDRLVDRMTGVI